MISKKLGRMVVGLGSVGLLLIAIAGQAATDISSLKSKATQECNSTKSLMQKSAADLAASSAAYKNLGAEVSVTVKGTGYSLPAVKNALLSGVNNSLTSVNELCLSISSSDDATVVQNAYNGVIEKRDVFKAVTSKINSWNTFYGKVKSSVSEYNYFSALANDENFRGYLVNSPSLANEKVKIEESLAVMETNLPSIFNGMPIADFYTGLFAKTVAAAKSDISGLDSKISQKNTWLTGNGNSYKIGYTALFKVMDIAAQEKVPKTGEIYTEYNKLYNSYLKKAQSLQKSVKDKAANYKKSLTDLKNKISPSGSLKALSLLDASVATTLVEKIDSLINELNSIDSALNPDVSYKTATTKNEALNALAVGTIIIPTINFSISANKDVAKLNDAKVVYDRFTSSYSTLVSGLDADNSIDDFKDKGDLDKIQTNFNNINTTYLTPLRGSDKTSLEQKIKNNVGSTADINSLTTFYKDYNKKTATAYRETSKNRSNWWKLITQAAINGRISGFSSKTWVIEENKAKTIVESFEKKRTSYMEQARKLIDTRKTTLDKNQAKIDALTYIPEAVKTTVNFSARTQALEASLETYYTDSVLPVQNYNELVTNVKAIKPTFKITEVYIPLQSVYLNFDLYYKKWSALEAVMNDTSFGLGARLDALKNSGNAQKVAAADALLPTYNEIKVSDLAPMVTNFNALLNTNLKEALDANDILLVKTVKNMEATYRSDLSSLTSKIRNLNSSVRKAESIKDTANP